jgi:RHS repeat-associated protein
VTASQISYDGLGRMVKLVEKNGVTTLQDCRFVWLNDVLYQERNAQGTVVKQFFPDGFKAVAATTGVPVGSYYYGRNQLGSIINVTDGTDQSRAVYSYDPYGQRYQVSGDVNADFGYTGLFLHADSGLDFALYRVYDPSSKRWLSRDPIGEKGGINLCGYVGNDPVNAIDPGGLATYYVTVQSILRKTPTGDLREMPMAALPLHRHPELTGHQAPTLLTQIRGLAGLALLPLIRE